MSLSPNLLSSCGRFLAVFVCTIIDTLILLICPSQFLKKMLADRQHSMSSLVSMGNEVAANADPAERKAIERQLNELMTRFDNLNEGMGTKI